MYCRNFRSKTGCATCDNTEDDPYFSSYAHFGIHEEMLKVRQLRPMITVALRTKRMSSLVTTLNTFVHRTLQEQKATGILYSTTRRFSKIRYMHKSIIKANSHYTIFATNIACDRFTSQLQHESYLCQTNAARNMS